MFILAPSVGLFWLALGSKTQCSAPRNVKLMRMGTWRTVSLQKTVSIYLTNGARSAARSVDPFLTLPEFGEGIG